MAKNNNLTLQQLRKRKSLKITALVKFMKKFLIPLLLCGALLVSCSKNENDELLPPRQVILNFTAKALSDITARSAASEAENAIVKLALFGIDANGEVVQTFPVIENPRPTGNVLLLFNEVKSIVVIANPPEYMPLDYRSLSSVKNASFDLCSAPSPPFVMSGEVEVNSNSINVELIRTVAKIEVKGMNGFNVSSVAVINTPSYGHLFTKKPIPPFALSECVSYPEQLGAALYVGENSKNHPTRLLVKGDYNGAVTAYDIALTQNTQAIDILRNTAYEVSIIPITAEECIVNVTVPDWNDLVADDNFIPNFGTYYAVDFHQHTTLSDGNFPVDEVLEKGWQHGLDFMVNSERGGYFNGKWRWQAIIDNSFPQIRAFNRRGMSATAIQGLEWNVPGHEHCAVGVISGQFDAANPNALAISQFEYIFDDANTDTTGGQARGWIKSSLSGRKKAMEAAEWLQTHHQYSSWLVPAHPERANAWQIEDFREMNDIAPDVFVAFEGVPGHQANFMRGQINETGSYKNTYTLGGVGIQAAKIGDLWDAMLSEGRHFWLVSNSDFHGHVTYGGSGFYPGEYQKTYISMKSKTPQGFVDGLRSGNIFCVHGDLIDRLEFSAGNATMGQTYSTNKSSVKIRILVHNPESQNNNAYSTLTTPELHHIDLIAGKMRDKVQKENPEYTVNTYNDVEVIARFDARGGIVDDNGLVSIKWMDLGGGLKLMEYYANITGDTYFRLRGTNHGLAVAGKTDACGNPLPDTPPNSASIAFEDLWFYSNPVFVRLVQ